MHGKRGAAQQFILPNGDEAPSSRQAGKALIGTRAHIWFTRPPADGPQNEVARAYCTARPHSLPFHPPLQPATLRGRVLLPAGSGVGSDNTPYEAYQLHPQLTACWLAQGFIVLAGTRQVPLIPTPDPHGPTPNTLDTVLGPAIDLSVWIPKVAGDFRVDKQRGLQLPTCGRRLFGGAGTHEIAPAIEPAFDPAQAAVRGGSCARNIRAAFQHLETEPSSEDNPGYCLWACTLIFGSLAQAVIQACANRQARDLNTKRIPGAFLLDQAKAFEMLSHTWLRLILTTWKHPLDHQLRYEPG